MDTLVQDLRYAFRQIRRSRGFSAVAIVVLTLGIGVNSALFTGMTALTARAAPGIGDPGGVVRVMPAYRSEGRSDRLYASEMSFPDFLEYAARRDIFDGLAAGAAVRVPLSRSEGSRVARAMMVTKDYFPVLRVKMAMGSAFSLSGDSVPAAIPMVVVSHHFWDRELDRAPDVLGRTLELGGIPFRIVGVAPERFNGEVVGPAYDLWLPIGTYPLLFPHDPTVFTKRDSTWLVGVGRLTDNVSIDQAERAASAIAARLASTKPVGWRGVNRAIVAPVSRPHAGSMNNDTREIGTLIGVITLLILAIACANVTGLLLGRAVVRRREIAVRLSLGASRRRVVRQLVTESVVLALIASAAALLVTFWITQSIDSVLFDVPVDLSPDWRVVAFTTGIALATGVGFGLIPALHASRSHVADALKDGAAGLDRRRSRLQSGFVVAQVAMSLVLLVAAGTLITLLHSGTQIPLGFDASARVLATTLDLDLRDYSGARADDVLNRLAERVRSMPGVEHAAFTTRLPLTYASRRFLTVQTPRGESPTRSRDRTSSFAAATVSIVDPEYFATMGMPIVRGRGIEPTDGRGSLPVVVVSEDFAEHTWPGGDPLGKRVILEESGPGRGESPADTLFTVVGVVPAMNFYGSPERDSPPPQLVFAARRQRPDSMGVSLVVRTTGDASRLAPLIRSEVQRVDPHLPITMMTTMESLRRERLADYVTASLIAGSFGGLALLLACVGVYAIVAFAVAQRSREIGIRMALGARSGQVIALFFRDGMRLTGLGLAIGLAIGIAVMKILQATWVGVNMASFVALAAISAAMLGVSALATWLPARRAATVDPLVALKAE